MTPTGSPPSSAPTPGGDIALVVATELELEERLARAREEARILVEAAYDETGKKMAELDRELAQGRERFAADVRVERDRRSAEVMVEGAREAARYDSITEHRLAELVGLVLSRLGKGSGA